MCYFGNKIVPAYQSAGHKCARASGGLGPTARSEKMRLEMVVEIEILDGHHKFLFIWLT